jgi:catechol 2,3-dioxygenase-like lactoylglutathione lyase family enzyme
VASATCDDRRVPLNHVALTVGDRERSARFYARHFGLTERIHDDQHLLIIRSGDGSLLSLREGPVPDGLPRTNHFGFELGDLDQVRAARTRLREAGIAETEWEDGQGLARVQVADPDGYRVELFAYAQASTSLIAGQADVHAWLAAYERAWRTAGTASLGELFTEDATYQPSPYEKPLAGLGSIAGMWEAEREGPDEPFTMKRALVALEDNVAVVRVEVEYERSTPHEYRDLWVIRFGDDGRCISFEEWPYWPGQLRAATVE